MPAGHVLVTTAVHLTEAEYALSPAVDSHHIITKEAFNGYLVTGFTTGSLVPEEHFVVIGNRVGPATRRHGDEQARRHQFDVI